MIQDWSRIDGPVTACFEIVSERKYGSLLEALRANERAYWSSPRVRYYRDEFGIVIPAWKIEETNRLNPRPVYSWSRDRVYTYRWGPVPGVFNRRGGRHSYRRIATSAELRENDFLWYDEDAIEHSILPRASRRRGTLPTFWDDGRFARRGNGWKKYRATQYRVDAQSDHA